ncbi:hypothetical protein LshimejAT787_0405410 [Lyophyllum shimeji]|uniref:Uncharacterized protein n=1 Tax=Lyophyllum shimeji TaxID=47721 RepID=A0A9P3PKB4_LYOSH|nr:hypothetical protein LshimejAT787_0405410 [Lyophyllum shimeji]
MAKTSKKAPVAPTKPISAFFTRKSAAAPSSSAPKLDQSLSGQGENTKPSKPSASPLEKSASHSSISNISVPSATKSTATISDASSPLTPPNRLYMDAVEIVSPSSSSNSRYLKPPSNPFTKRAGSPGKGSLSLRDGARPSPGRQRRSVFDSDSDVEKSAPAVYLLRSPVRPASVADAPTPAPLRARENLTQPSSQINTNPKKKQRLSSPEPCGELVPTSQSDEFEMAPAHSTQRDPALVKRSVDEWRHNAVSDPASLSDNPFKESPNIPTVTLEGTPPPPNRLSSLSPLPASPMVLDPTTKAAQIIADIKARAYAESLRNRPETPVREFKDELSDSDDDMLPESPIRGRGKGGASAHLPAVAARSSGRCSLRNQRPSPSPSAPKQSASSSQRTRVASTHCPSAVTAKGKGKAYNPLDALLKEKKRDDQRGKGSEALRQAEAALANRDAIMLDVDDDFTNEAAAQKAVLERKRTAMKSSSPMAYDANESDDELNDEERTRLLGEKRGKAIVNLLDTDKAMRAKDVEKVAGTPFWQGAGEMDDLMEVDEVAFPPLDISKPHPLLSALRGAIERKDIAQATLLIGSIASIHLGDHTNVIPYLCELALLPEATTLCTSALQVVTHIWSSSIRQVPGISFACISRVLARLGAQRDVLSAMGWPVPDKLVPISARKRDSVLCRLVMLVTASARSRRLSNDEVPDVLMSLILVANEPSSSHELRDEIMLAIDEVCRSIASGGDISASLESTICTGVLKYVSTVEPVNKAYITGLFGSGSGRTRRIARWIAHGIITDNQIVTPKRYSDLPPLLALAAELTRKRLDDADAVPGKFELHEKTDFVDMAFYVQILGVGITNVVGYVTEERKAPRPPPSLGGVASEPPQPPLGLIRLAIESLHSRISDLRATRLDRSRAKAALKELSLRIYYQRQAALQSARTLHTYFTKTKKANTSSS